VIIRLGKLSDAFDRFLFDGCDPRIIPPMRIGFAIIILIQSLVAWPDAERWFTDAGLLNTQTAKELTSPGSWSLLFWLPSNVLTVKVCLGLLIGHALFMLVGVASRFQAAAIFVWLVSFQNRNPLITDGEDIVFRIMAFLFIWLPLDCGWSLWNRKRSTQSFETSSKADAWGLRLIQIQMTAIYASTALCKTQGVSWWNGTAVWFVSRLSDDYGRAVPKSFLDLPWTSEIATWGTLLIEFLLPIALWIRPIRNYAVLVGLMLHLGIELSMNLFLFQWIMMLGLLSFIDFDRFPFKRSAVRDAP
jgi:hypothetical protein